MIDGSFVKVLLFILRSMQWSVSVSVLKPCFVPPPCRLNGKTNIQSLELLSLIWVPIYNTTYMSNYVGHLFQFPSPLVSQKLHTANIM